MRLVQKCTVRRIKNYLASTSTYVDLIDRNSWLTTCGIVFRTDIEKGIECYIDVEFSSGWYQSYDDNAENAMPHRGYVITYVGCPVLWCIKLQT